MSTLSSPPRATPFAPYQLIVFDVDGTLADTFPFFLSVYNDLAMRHGFAAITDAQVPELRRLPPREIMRRIGLPRYKLPLVAASFMALMREQDEPAPLFDGIDEALRGLHAAGAQLAVITSNALDNVLRLIGPELDALLSDRECGMSMFGKAPRIHRVMRRCGADAAHTLFVGDQLSDRDAARKAGIDFCAVGWGYNAFEAMAAAQPELAFERPSDLLAALR